VFRVGVIGTGWVAQNRHIPCFSRVPGARVTGVYDQHYEVARGAADRAGIGLVARSLEELLESGIDAVAVATSPWTHAEYAGKALAAGLHVFCEKPMALTLADARSMAAAAADAGRILTISHNFRFSRSATEAGAYLRGELPLYAAAVQLSSERRRLPSWYRDLPAGLLLDEVPHLLYTLRSFCGPLQVAAARAAWRSDGHPGIVEVELAGESPARATMVFGAPVSEWHVTLVGRRRIVDLDLFRDIAVRVGADGQHLAKDIARTSASVMVGHGMGFARSGFDLVRHRQYWGHDRLIAAFVNACQGRGLNPVPTDEALAIVGMTDDLLPTIGVRKRQARRARLAVIPS
jgi:scyllo-inositol 2-dehydrogenase (NADP+)